MSSSFAVDASIQPSKKKSNQTVSWLQAKLQSLGLMKRKSIKTNSDVYLGVTVPLRNNCRNSCVIAKIQARSGEISHTAPRKRDFPQNFRKTARLMFNKRNTHVTPAKRNKNTKWKLEEGNKYAFVTWHENSRERRISIMKRILNSGMKSEWNYDERKEFAGMWFDDDSHSVHLEITKCLQSSAKSSLIFVFLSSSHNG